MLFFFLFGGLAIYYILTTRLIVGNNSYKRNTDYPLIEFSLNMNIDHLQLQSVYFAKIENADRDSGVKFKLQVLGIDNKIFPGGGMVNNLSLCGDSFHFQKFVLIEIKSRSKIDKWVNRGAILTVSNAPRYYTCISFSTQLASHL